MLFVILFVFRFYNPYKTHNGAGYCENTLDGDRAPNLHDINFLICTFNTNRWHMKLGHFQDGHP